MEVPKQRDLRDHKILDQSQQREALVGRLRDALGGPTSHFPQRVRERDWRNNGCGARSLTGGRSHGSKEHEARATRGEDVDNAEPKAAGIPINYHHGADIKAKIIP